MWGRTNLRVDVSLFIGRLQKQTVRGFFVTDIVVIPTKRFSVHKIDVSLGHFFDASVTRFLYAIHVPSEVFVKLARPQYNIQLQREYAGMRIARQMGIPTLELKHPYSEGKRGHGMIGISLLRPHETLSLNLRRLTPGQAQDMAQRFGALVLKMQEKYISQVEGDFNLLFHKECRASSSLFYFEKRWITYRQEVLSISDREEFWGSIRQFDRFMEVLTTIEAHPLRDIFKKDRTKWYFAHNDLAPHNIHLKSQGSTTEDSVLDFEWVNLSRYKNLGWAVDFGNLYARCWKNALLQQGLIKTVFSGVEAESRQLQVRYMEKGMVFATLGLARVAVSENPREHEMAKALLRQLSINIAYLNDLAREV
jgi:hypothetical protein